MRSKLTLAAAFGAIFALALVLRLWGIGFGLPDLYHPDEPAYVLQALAVARGLPDGLTFANPPLFKYVLLAEYALVYALQRLAGMVSSQQAFIDAFRADPSMLYLIARATSAVFGAATALAAGALGAELRGPRIGLIAAVFTAVAYLLVRDAHFGVNDAMVTLLVTLGLTFCVRVIRRGERRDYIAAGLLAGLAFAAKYQGIVVLVPLVVAHVWRSKRRSLNLAFGLGACLVSSVVAFPSLVTEPGRVVGDIYLHLYLAAAGGYDGLDPAGGYAFYARALSLGLGWPLLAAAAVGIGLSALRRERSSLIVALLPVALLVVLGSQRLYFARFALPALPALLVEASLAVDSLMALRTSIGVAAVLLAATPSVLTAVRFDALMSQPDTRALTRDWINANVPPGATVAVDSAPLGPTLTSASGQERNVLIANDWSLFDLSPSDYRAQGVEFVVVSSFTSEARPIDPARDAHRQAFNAAIETQATRVAQFRPYAGDAEPAFIYDQIYGPFDGLDVLERPGPTVTVYRVE